MLLALLISSSSLWAADQGFRWDESTRSCRNAAGQPGLNPDFLGECGSIKGKTLTQASLAPLTSVRGSIFDTVKFVGLVVRNLDFTGAKLKACTITQTSFVGSSFAEVSMERSRFQRSFFRDSNLVGSLWTGNLLAKTGFERVRLDGIDLSSSQTEGLDLIDCQARRVRFRSGTIFQNARLTGTDFSEATLTSADLTGAIAARTIWRKTELTGANLTRARLSEATLDEAILTRARAGSAMLASSSLRDTLLEGAMLEFADLRGSVLANTRLSGARMPRASLRGARIEGPAPADQDILRDAEIDGASAVPVDWGTPEALGLRRVGDMGLPAAVSDPALRFHFDTTARKCVDASGIEGRNLGIVECGEAPAAGISGFIASPGLNLRGFRAAGAKVTGSDFSRADLTGSDWRHSLVKETLLAGAVLVRSDWTGSQLDQVDLSDARAAESIFRGVYARQAKLVRIDWDRSALERSYWDGATWTGATLDGAAATSLTAAPNAVFDGVSLVGTRLAYASLMGADLSAARFRPSEIAGALVRGARLPYAVLSGIDARGSDWSGAEVRATDFSGALLWASILDGLLADSSFFVGAKMASASLFGASLQNAHLQGADLTDASLTAVTSEGLIGARFDSSTAMPLGADEAVSVFQMISYP